MKIKLTTLFFCFITVVFSQKIDFNKSILTIPDSLSRNANLVNRFHHTNIKIVSRNDMRIKYHKLITVLNKHGDKRPHFLEFYNGKSDVKNLKIYIYNSLGKLIKKVKSREINDVAANDGFSLFSDGRIEYYKHIPNKYPYTIEISYEVKTSNTAFIPSWYALGSYNKSTQKDTYTITYPEDLKLNLKEFNFERFPIKKKIENNTITYSVANIKALQEEDLSPDFSNIAPNVVFALNKFELSGENGSAENWNDFGKWMYEKLLKGRNQLTDKTKKEINQLVANIDNPIERAKLVYKYMQGKTRYVSVQIGIGGWKPMLAKDVDELGYGDCKALTNYTQSLLKEANVPSLYTIVYAGNKRDIKKDLVSVQGNHAILMVPTKKDTIWLECTSQKLPFGQTGDTDDRDVFVVTNKGGKIIHTNIYKETFNLQKISGELTINNDNGINASIKIISSGKQYNNSYYLTSEKKEEQILHYKKRFSNILDANIESIEFTNDKKQIVFIENILLNTKNYTEKIGNDIIFKPNAFNVYNNLPQKAKNRKFSLVINNGFKDEDEITINIPNNYKLDKLPDDLLIENKFGKYKIEFIKVNNQKLIYKRLFIIKDATYKNTEYNNYRNFIKKVIKHDNQKIIINTI